MAIRLARLEKFFVWEFRDFDPEALHTFSPPFSPCLRLLQHKVRGFDRYNNVKRKTTLECKLLELQDSVIANFRMEPLRSIKIIRTEEYCLFNNDGTTRHPTNVQGKFSRLLFCVDLEVVPSAFQSIGVRFSMKSISACFYKENLSKNFVIKCRSESIEANKNVLSYFSDVFKTMFGSDFKEAQENCMDITDFGPQVVRKMVEFIETYKIENFDGCEEDIFKIAHRYQIEDLMNYAVYEMFYTTTEKNRFGRLKLAEIYGLDKFKKWLIKF